MSDDDPTKDLALMVPHFEEVKIVFKNKKIILEIINLAKIPL
jgi:hypothetical protein